jgi:hypothetical protein
VLTFFECQVLPTMITWNRRDCLVQTYGSGTTLRFQTPQMPPAVAYVRHSRGGSLTSE